jgi:monovalent cation/hydrogen antiporter
MHHQVLLVLSLLFAIGLLHVVSSKLRVSFPILLVLGGLAISLLPGLPEVRLDPELVFLVFLPPLLYEAAWYTSWHDFWRLRRPILIQAFGLVFFTSSVVAWVAHLAGFPWALGFLLGGIVSPPDAVAATSVLKGLPVQEARARDPRRREPDQRRVLADRVSLRAGGGPHR